MSNIITRNLQAAKNYLLPTMGGPLISLSGRDQNPKSAAKNLSNYISPVQLARIKQDIQTWRDCMTEMENAWYPQRVKVQRLYLDTIVNGHVAACLTRRWNLTMLKDWKWVDEKGNINEEVQAIFKNKVWFRDYMRYVLEAKAFGYSLIFLGDLKNDNFPDLSIIRRFNISPDRLNVTQFPYSLSGAKFLDEPYRKWHIWCDTPTDVGVSKCGYGFLYKVAFYEIIARNVISQNVDATELYGMPIRVGKTSKSAESGERQIFEEALRAMGSAGYMLMDPLGDDVQLLESKSLGNGYKIYESLEQRCFKVISKIILGHSDVIDSVPGRLGAQMNTADSPVNQALRDTATNDMNDIIDITNNQLKPQLQELGFKIPDNIVFEFDNNEETEENREKEDKANLTTAQIYQSIKLAGGDPDWDYFSERTGIKTEKLVLPTPVVNPNFGGSNGNGKPVVDPKIKARVEQLYKTGRVLNGNGHLNGNGNASH